MMKTAFAAAALLAATGAAQAQVGPYIGADYVYSAVDYADDNGDYLEDKLHGVSPYVGVQISDYVGVEASYLKTEKAEKDFAPGARSKVSMEGYGIDVVGTLPLTEDNGVALLASAGVGRYEAKVSTNTPIGNGSGSDKDTGYRAGLGAQFQLTDNLGVRAMARYIDVDFDDVADHVVTGSLGLNYKF